MWEPAGFLAGKIGGTGTFLQGAGRAEAWGAQASGAPFTGMGLSPITLLLLLWSPGPTELHLQPLVQGPLLNTFQKVPA